MRDLAAASPPPNPIPTTTADHAWAWLNGPRHTVATRIPASSTSAIERPGMRANRDRKPSTSKNFAASRPGITRIKIRPSNTRRVCRGFENSPP